MHYLRATHEVISLINGKRFGTEQVTQID